MLQHHPRRARTEAKRRRRGRPLLEPRRRILLGRSSALRERGVVELDVDPALALDASATPSRSPPAAQPELAQRRR